MATTAKMWKATTASPSAARRAAIVAGSEPDSPPIPPSSPSGSAYDSDAECPPPMGIDRPVDPRRFTVALDLHTSAPTRPLVPSSDDDHELTDILNDAGKRAPESIETYSEATRKRAYVYKVYMRQFYRDLFQYRGHRLLRKAEMDHEITTLGLGAEQAAAMRKEYAWRETQYLRLKRTKTKINDFTILAMLGKGGYGEVYLARENQTGRVLALKRMTKNSAAMKNQIDEVQRERNVLSTSHSPWIIRLVCSFQDSHYLYMGMEYAPGGDLRWLLNNLGRLDDAMSSTYAAEMVLCIKYLHSLGYTHRDLKPSNFVIDQAGHLKLIDFGLSREGWEERNRAGVRYTYCAKRYLSTGKLLSLASEPRSRISYSIVGSPDYMCPEMVQGRGYDHRADWWAFGAIFYEMVVGDGAFAAATAEEAFDNVVHFERVVAEKPAVEGEPVPSDAWDLIRGLLAPEERRLGQFGAGEIIAHPYFVRRKIAWDNLRDKPGPFVPQLESEADTSYFGEGEEQQEPEEGMEELTTRQEVKQSVDSAELPTSYFSRINDESYFAGFTYKAFPSGLTKKQ